MAQVTVKLNGYSYTVGCEDGQEEHLELMAEQVEKRIDSIRSLGGSSGEARLLVLATLLMADELHDMRIEADTLRMAAASTVRHADDTGSKAPLAQPDAEVTRRLARLAVRAEQIADSLEHP